MWTVYKAAWIHTVDAKFCPYHQCASPDIVVHQTRLRPVLGNLCSLQPWLSSLDWQKWNPMWFSAVVAHVPQGAMICTFCSSPQEYRVIIWVTAVFLSAQNSLAILSWLTHIVMIIWSCWPVSALLYTLHWCHIIGWSDNYLNKVFLIKCSVSACCTY